MAHVFSLDFNKILNLLAHMTFYSLSAVIGYAAGYKHLKKYNNNNNIILYKYQSHYIVFKYFLFYYYLNS